MQTKPKQNAMMADNSNGEEKETAKTKTTQHENQRQNKLPMKKRTAVNGMDKELDCTRNARNASASARLLKDPSHSQKRFAADVSPTSAHSFMMSARLSTSKPCSFVICGGNGHVLFFFFFFFFRIDAFVKFNLNFFT